MKKYCSSLLIATGIIYSLSCNDVTNGRTVGTDTATFDLSRTRSYIDSVNDKFEEAFERGDTTALVAHYSSDARLMVPNRESIKGNEIASAWGDFTRLGVKDVKINTEDVTGGNDLAVETGTYEFYGDNNRLIDKGKYVVVWRRENGEWKIYRDIGNTSMPQQQQQRR